jgi:mono/diheme cytochrome c family protein
MRFEEWLGVAAAVTFLAAFQNTGARSSAKVQNPANTAEIERVLPSLDGPTLYATYCAVCHGKAGDGQGPMAPSLKVRVPDLTEIAKRNGGVFPFARVEKTIDGTELAGLAHGTREMPVWGPLFSQVTYDRDYGRVRIHNLTKYLQSIQKWARLSPVELFDLAPRGRQKTSTLNTERNGD